ncbi:MAG: hypothetical protein K5790_10480 [Nitrosopumilus sp.]|uniref:hypothetical protein n=1 Tax=Nitrosopumilus sp. TaxID=2024843 RepID=UPI00247DF1D5|nr:hypothetical protein [Nitrosopumilus sp.]MCV0393696.1 hypothetical protein [Nitrosopumilus sp.]
MKSKQKLVFSGNDTSKWNVLLKEVKKQAFFEAKQNEAKHLIESDSKVHLKKIGDSAFKLLKYAGYADSRQSVKLDNNRDSKNNSQQLKVIMN